MNLYNLIAPSPKQLADIARLLDEGAISHKTAVDIIEGIVEGKKRIYATTD